MLTSRPFNTSLDRMMTLNRAFDQAFNGSLNRVWVPAVDVSERKDAYVVHAELPGVARENLDISFEQNVLTLRGTKPVAFDAQNDGDLRVFVSERVSGNFERSVRLPEFVDPDRIDAELTNGLLTIIIPKAQAAQARKIAIK